MKYFCIFSHQILNTTTTIISLFLAIIIGFNIWNTINLHSLLKKPLKSDFLNDKNYWELKYKMQYLITVFSIILFVAGYLGINTIDNAKENLRKDFQSSLDSLNSKLLLSTQSADQQFKRMDSTRQILDLLDLKQKEVSTFISGTYKSADQLSKRISDLMAKDIIKQNIYIVEKVKYQLINNEAEYLKYQFKDLLTLNGEPLPKFSKPPLILGVSNDGSDMHIRKITTESFELQVYSFLDVDYSKIFVTLIIIENR